tara:strand:- start:630 stop:2168 length:1539 start_codon:yes stop_codon:yes gene_type:complete
MAIDPNVFYRAGAIKGQLARQAKQDRQQSIDRFTKMVANVSNIIGQKMDEYDKNMSDFNGEIPRDTVPESAMMDLTRHIAREKAVYTKNAKIIRSSLSRKKKREAMEENEQIKSGLAAVYGDFEKAKAMGQAAEKLIPFIAKGADLEKKDNALDFANNKWYERGVKFTRNGITINGVKEEQVVGEDGQPLPQSKLVNYDQRLSDISFPDPVKGIGGKAFSQTADLFQKEGLKNGRLLTEDALEVKKAEYVQGLKNMPIEEQRHLYFNGIGGFPGSSQAETDAAKAIGLDAEGFKKMNEPIDENNPKDVAEKTRLREQFQNQLNALSTKKEFLTPELIDNQWSTIMQAYDSGVKEHERKETERKNYQASRNQKDPKDLNATLDGSSYIKVSQARTIANQMSQPGNVAYTGSKTYKFDTLPNNMVQLQRYDKVEDKYVNYNPSGGDGPITLNEALNFRGIGQEITGLYFQPPKLKSEGSMISQSTNVLDDGNPGTEDAAMGEDSSSGMSGMGPN